MFEFTIIGEKLHEQHEKWIRRMFLRGRGETVDSPLALLERVDKNTFRYLFKGFTGVESYVLNIHVENPITTEFIKQTRVTTVYKYGGLVADFIMSRGLYKLAVLDGGLETFKTKSLLYKRINKL